MANARLKERAKIQVISSTTFVTPQLYIEEIDVEVTYLLKETCD